MSRCHSWMPHTSETVGQRCLVNVYKWINFQKSILGCKQFLRIKVPTQSIDGHHSDHSEREATLGVKNPFEQTYKSSMSSVSPSNLNKLITGNLYSWDKHNIFYSLVQLHRPFAMCFQNSCGFVARGIPLQNHCIKCDLLVLMVYQILPSLLANQSIIYQLSA